MIVLNNNSVNENIVVTLNEDTTLTGDSINYLWSIVSDDTNESVEFIATEKSTNICRYNSFDITLTGSTDINLTGGTVNMEPNGTWKYSIYQQESATNLDLSLTGDLVEIGRVLVVGEDNPTITPYTGNTVTRITYNG